MDQLREVKKLLIKGHSREEAVRSVEEKGRGRRIKTTKRRLAEPETEDETEDEESECPKVINIKQ